MRSPSKVLSVGLALSLAAPLLLADATNTDTITSTSDCDTLRAVHQRMGGDESLDDARHQLARAIVLLPGCVRVDGRVQQARTLDGVEVFRAGALPEHVVDRESGQ